MGIEIMA